MIRGFSIAAIKTFTASRFHCAKDKFMQNPLNLCQYDARTLLLTHYFLPERCMHEQGDLDRTRRRGKVAAGPGRPVGPGRPESTKW